MQADSLLSLSEALGALELSSPESAQLVQLHMFLGMSIPETAGRMMTSSPALQFAGVATFFVAVSWQESSSRRISTKLRPVLMG